MNEDEFIERYCENCDRLYDCDNLFDLGDTTQLEVCMEEKKGEKMEYCISGFYSETIEAESKEEAIEMLMEMELRNITKVDIDYINDETYIYDNM